MPLKKAKRKFFRKKTKDKKQDQRLKKLESMLYKTIENKQVDYTQDLNISSGGTATYPLLRVAQGVEDGNQVGDPARIGNNITLMREMCDMNFIGEGVVGGFNQIRVLIVESIDGNMNLTLSDVLKYHSFAVDGDRVFVSPYTTKTGTNRRYKVHMDKVFELNSNKNTKQIHFRKNYKNGKVIEFDGNAAGGNPTSRQQHIFMISDSLVAPHPSCKYAWRSTYKDA